MAGIYNRNIREKYQFVQQCDGATAGSTVILGEASSGKLVSRTTKYYHGVNEMAIQGSHYTVDHIGFLMGLEAFGEVNGAID